ncbi:MAG: hypothetical protein KDD36_07760 [Flavobacteriales bacterium]|nr:hypothetical protein [Flavobacteriales bacterium]
MRKILLICGLMAVMAMESFAQPGVGIGFRLGDLNGISVKSNFGDNAVEVSVGRLLRFSNHSYETWFYNKKIYTEGYYAYRYAKIGIPLSLQAHYLKHRTIDFADPLRWYYGIGGQVRMYPVEYTYWYYPDPNLAYKEAGVAKRKSWEAGVDWVLGLEYNFPEVPIGLYMDAQLYMEVYDSPFFSWGLFGIGARYNF